MFVRFVNSVLNGSFLNQPQTEKIIKILLKQKVTINLHTFYYLRLKEVDLTPFLPQLQKIDSEKLPSKILVMMAIAVAPYAKESSEAKTIVAEATKVLENNFSSPRNFIYFIKRKQL